MQSSSKADKSKKQGGPAPVGIAEFPEFRKEKPVFPAFVPSAVDMKGGGGATDTARDQSYETNQLYISNLPRGTNMQDLTNMFPDCVGITLGVNNANEPHAAYVEFPDRDSTKDACMRNRGASIHGNTVIISPKIKYS